MALISHSELRRLLAYDAVEGTFIRKVATGRWGRSKPGTQVGRPSDSCPRSSIRIGGRLYATCRLAWFYQTGAWPNGEIDHINGNPADNRFANLRVASRTENGRNLKLSDANTSGFKGVHLHRASGRWRARIAPDRKSIHLGLFDTPEEAHAAYLAAAAQYFGEFARGG